MIFFLLIGILLGAVAVVFILQNTAVVTITFLAWQLQGSLALFLFLAIMTGVVITLLILLPSSIRDTFALSRERRKKKLAEEELEAHKRVLATQVASAPITTDTTLH